MVRIFGGHCVLTRFRWVYLVRHRHIENSLFVNLKMFFPKMIGCPNRLVDKIALGISLQQSPLFVLNEVDVHFVFRYSNLTSPEVDLQQSPLFMTTQ